MPITICMSLNLIIIEYKRLISVVRFYFNSVMREQEMVNFFVLVVSQYTMKDCMLLIINAFQCSSLMVNFIASLGQDY